MSVRSFRLHVAHDVFPVAVEPHELVSPSAITDPNGNVRQVNFNTAGYPTSITWAMGKPEAQSFNYTRAAGTNLLTASTDALGRTTSYTYDSMGNLTAATVLAGTSQAVTTNYTYEPVYNRLITYTDGLGQPKPTAMTASVIASRSTMRWVTLRALHTTTTGR